MTVTEPQGIRPNAPQRHPVSVDPALEQLQRLIDWFVAHVEELHVLPFALGTGMHIADPPMFYAALQRDIHQGVAGPRTKLGGSKPIS